MRLVLLAGTDIAVAAGVGRGRSDATAQPFRRLVAGVTPVLVVVGNRPATVQVPPYGRISIRQRLGAHFGDERWTEASQVSPVAMGPAVAAVQVLVTSTCERGTRRIKAS